MSNRGCMQKLLRLVTFESQYRTGTTRIPFFSPYTPADAQRNVGT